MSLDEISIAEVWKQLGGPELRPKSHLANVYGPAFWRGSKDRNVSLNIRKNCFHDWPTDNKGGSLALVRIALGCSKPDAVRWLELHCGLDPARPFTATELAQRRCERELLAWRDALLAVLKRRRNRHWRIYHQSKNWILKYSLANMRGCLLAEVADLSEEIALETDHMIERLSELTPAQLEACYCVRGHGRKAA